MNCMEFESLVVAMAREDLAGAAAYREGLSHAKTCARCARRLANEQALNAVVAAVTDEDRGRAAPLVVERMLLAAFHERQAAGRKRRQSWFRRAVVGGIAASFILAAILALRMPESPHVAHVKSATPAPAIEPAKIIEPVYHEPRKPPVRTLRAARRKPVEPPKMDAVNGEVATDFIPLVYDPEPVDRGRVVRVRLPRAALRTFGLPVNEQLSEEPIQADVLLGEDGLARAVRFVR